MNLADKILELLREGYYVNFEGVVLTDCLTVTISKDGLHQMYIIDRWRFKELAEGNADEIIVSLLEKGKRRLIEEKQEAKDFWSEE